VFSVSTRLIVLCVVVAVASTLVASVQAGSAGAALRPILIVTGSKMNQIRDDDPDLAAYHFDRKRAYAIGNEFERQNQVPSGYRARPTLKYESFRRFRADVRNRRIARSIEVVIYDPENWEETPYQEKRDPKRFMGLFARLAREHDYRAIVSPARDLVSVPYALCHQRSGESLDDAFLRCRIPAAAARHANAYKVQAQVHEDDPGAYRRFVSRARRQARKANPRVAILSNLATSPADYVATAEMLWSAHEAVDDLVVGHQLNINTTELTIAESFLRMMRDAGE
jgi:hypothetical protein